MTTNLFHIAVSLVAFVGTAASAAELNALTDLRISATPQGAQLVVTGDRAPTFTVFRLSDPDRLVIDLSSADVTAIKGHREGAGPVTGVVVSQFSDERASIGRLMLALDKVSQYDVKADGNRVVVSVFGAEAAGVQKMEAQAVRAEELTRPGASGRAPEKASEEPKMEPPARREEGVVASHLDEKPVRHPARRILGLAFAKDALKIRTDGEVAKFELLELADPFRLAIDLYGVELGAKPPQATSALVKGIRVGAHGEKVRVVIDMRGQMPAYRASRLKDGVVLALATQPGPKLAEKPAASEKEVEPREAEEAEIEIDGRKMALGGSAETAPLEVAPERESRESQAVAQIKDLSFEESSQGGKVEIALDGAVAYEVDRPDSRSAVLNLEPAKLPKRLERSLDTSALQTPVKMVSAFSVPGGADKVRVVVVADGALEETVAKTPRGLVWRLNVKGVKTESVAVSPKASGFTSEAARFAETGAPKQRRYVGKRVSFEFKDIDIHNLLRIISEISKKNIVVADDVSGKVTIRLRNVPWDQALELILRSKGLGKEELGNNIIRVAPLKTLEEEAKIREERKKSLQRQEELVVQLIPVNYATAENMQARVKDVLSERGSVSVDARTNTLIVRDIASNIGRARQLVQRLDTQTPQVLIESRIVEANTNFTRQIGIQWGGQAQMAPATGNPTGLVFPNIVAVRGGSSNEPNLGTADVPNYAVNLPAAVGTGAGGALGFVFGSAGGALALNLRLSALEQQGVVKTISAPKVTTLDNTLARISQGVSIPFSQVSAAGVNTTFIEARLQLEVTPHITQDGSVLMNIKAENNQPDPANTGANGQPAIQRKEANTQVLVKDGDTTVIGGIYVRRASSTESSVPFFGRIPILGFFFRNSSDLEQRQELLIFITPRIINRQATSVAQNL